MGNPSERTPLSLRDIPRVVEKSVNSVSAFGAKSSVHFLSTPFPTEPHSAAVSSFAALRMRHTPCGYFVGLRRGPHWGNKSLPCKGRWRKAPERFHCPAGTPQLFFLLYSILFIIFSCLPEQGSCPLTTNHRPRPTGQLRRNPLTFSLHHVTIRKDKGNDGEKTVPVHLSESRRLVQADGNGTVHTDPGAVPANRQ